MATHSPNLSAQTSPAAADTAAWNLFVFRKSREPVSIRKLLEELRAAILQAAGETQRLLDALIRAGEIESGLEDAESPAACPAAALVDRLAALVCAGNPESCTPMLLLSSLERLDLPATIVAAHPEGFSYYGLNPLDFADLARRMAPELRPTAAVIGIRSVGSTLGAVVAAELRTHGIAAERITARPEGEPYRRKTTFTPPQQSWLQANLKRQSDFLVVDEGPGFSGSTFFSVAQALAENGIPHNRIMLMGSRPFPNRAGGAGPAPDWSRFRSCTIDYGAHAPADARRSLGDGAWRELLYPDRNHWPPCWLEQERIKHASRDGRIFFKFEGFGRFGRLAREQAEHLARAKLSPSCVDFERGYAGYEFVAGRPLSENDLSRNLLSRMAAYCAFRLACFPAPTADLRMLGAMACKNLEVEFGESFRGGKLEIPLERPVYPDCRMLPHEWLVSGNGPALKTDGVGHAEGHQLPGPADIAWDLAGTIVEWRLSTAAAEFFLEEYRRRTGDAAGKRVRSYVILYSILRMAQCRMSSVSMAGRREARYLRREYEMHAREVQALLEKLCI